MYCYYDKDGGREDGSLFYTKVKAGQRGEFSLSEIKNKRCSKLTLAMNVRYQESREQTAYCQCSQAISTGSLTALEIQKTINQVRQVIVNIDF